MASAIETVGDSLIAGCSTFSVSLQKWLLSLIVVQILIGRNATDKVDIFSYGVLLWEIVTGERPQRGQLRDCL